METANRKGARSRDDSDQHAKPNKKHRLNIRKQLLYDATVFLLAWISVHHLSAYCHVFSCCGGEKFVHLPLFGLAHVPATWEDARTSLLLPLTVFLVVLFAVLIYVPTRMWLLPRLPSLLRERIPWSHQCVVLLPLVSLGSAYVLLGGVLLPGEFGRRLALLVRPAAWNHDARYHQSRLLLRQWERRPELAPLGSIAKAKGGVPVANVTFWSEERANEIAERVLALRETHWTYSLGLARGTGLFLLGRKYSASSRSGRVLLPGEEHQMGMSLWADFEDVMEDLRAGCQQLVGAPTHLFRASHPPTFIIHRGSFASTHFESMDVHTDAILPKSMKDVVHAQMNMSTDGRGWRGARTGTGTCEWDKQLSLLVALALPPGGAGFDYYDAAGALTTLPHGVGRGILAECRRPHNLHPFARADAANPGPRMVLHAFAVPCRRRPRAAAEWQLIGPLGFGLPLNGRYDAVW